MTNNIECSKTMINRIDDIKAMAEACLRDEAKALIDLIPLLTDDFAKAVELMANCKGKVVVTGVGKSGHCGAKIAATLASTGTPAFFINPLDAYHGDLGMLASGDVVLAISNSGNTDELLRIIPLLTDRKIPIVAMTGNPQSLLARYSTYHLNIAVEHEADPLNLAPTSSTTATMAMGDALACALIKVRNFRPADFARYHPGGSLGKRLLAKVKNYMMSENLPSVKPTDKISDTIIQISTTKKGIALVFDEDRMVGVVTDGDVRRAMQSHQQEFFNLTVRDIMSTTPKTVNQEAHLQDAEEMMRKYNIHTLVVVNDTGVCVGLIDLFSCV